MIRNYITIAWRNLWKNKAFSLLNIVGLSAGIAFALLIMAYVWSETQINHQLRNASRQYFLTSDWKDPNLGNAITTFGPLAKRLKEDYPALVANYYRWDGMTSIVTKGEKHFREGIQLGDSTFLSMYGFQLLYGNAATALTEPYSTVITTDMAKKYFGRPDVVGESLSIQSFSGGNHAFTITGVLKPYTENSVMQLNAANHNHFFIPTNTYKYFGRSDFESWANGVLPSYVELQPGVTADQLSKPIEHLLALNTPAVVQTNLRVRPVQLTRYYLDQNNGLIKKMLYTLSLIGVFILLMAVINFVNITISSSGSRVREIGVRKVLGGLRRQLVGQFLTESLILVFIATAVALALYPLIKPFFESMVGKQILQAESFPWSFVFLPIGLSLIIGTIAGLYPAVVLSSMKTVDSLKGKLATVKEKVWLRKSLVAFQFCIALVVVIGASVITQQISHFFGRGLGYNKDFIVSSQVPRDWTPQGADKMEMVRDAFARLPDVKDVALSYEIPNGMNGGSPTVYKAGSDSTLAIPMQAMTTDQHYLSTFEIPLQSGSFFAGHRTDSGKVVLNQQAATALGYPNAADAVGKQLRIPGDPTVFTVKAVTRDFYFSSMMQKIPPIIFFNVQFAPAYRYLSFRLKPGNISGAIANIQQQWAQLLPGSSFEYSFMDQMLQQLYANELQLKNAAYAATLLTVIIMLLGVLGLVSLSIHKRIKEIGIRKILGAPVASIILLFVKDFLLVMIPAAAVAFPVAIIVMKNWLNNYADRINLSAMPFVVSSLALAGITLLLISLQTIKTALSNPVKSLRVD